MPKLRDRSSKVVNHDWPLLERELRKFLPKKAVVSKRQELLVYDCDGLTINRHTPPLAVLPETTSQVSKILKCCHKNSIPFVARGSGTGLSGGAVAEEETLLVITSRMREILAIDLENQTIKVQPGVINSWVTNAVKGDGFYYAPDPSSQIICSIGGNVAENSGGVHCLKYGVTSNHVMEIEVVLPNGEVTTLGGPINEPAELDLRGAFIGSEGTLGIATSITLRLLKAPQNISVLLADFPTMEAAGLAVSQITAAGLLPAGMEIMDNFMINAVNDLFGAEEYPPDAAAVLLIEIDGQENEVNLATEHAIKLCINTGARHIRKAVQAKDRERLWKGRKSAFAAVGKISSKYFVQDGVVPRSSLPKILKSIEILSKKYNLPIANVFHAGDGNLHPLILYKGGSPEIETQVKELGAEILKECLAVGGSITGEHGVGSDKRCYLDWMFTSDDLETMGFLRKAFDPHNRANPGKVFPTPRSCGESARKKVYFQDNKKIKESNLEVY